MYHLNPWRRYLFRKDVLRRARIRLSSLVRKITKNEFSDQRRILREISVDVIIDGGANVGHVSQIYRNAFPNARLYCFEPAAKVRATLLERFAGDSQVTVLPLALSDSTGQRTFHVNTKSGSSSLYRPSAANAHLFHLHEPTEVAIEAIRIDDFCARERIKEISILKLDVEGAEIEALNGAGAMLDNFQIGLIDIEVGILPLYSNRLDIVQIFAFLVAKQYKLFNIYEVSETEFGQGILANAIFLSPRLRQELTKRHGRRACGEDQC